MTLYEINAEGTPYGVNHCEVCGRPLRIQTVGRPALAHPECRKLESFLGAAERRLANGSFRFTRAAAKAWRQRCQLLGHEMNHLQDPPSDPYRSARSSPWQPTLDARDAFAASGVPTVQVPTREG